MTRFINRRQVESYGLTSGQTMYVCDQIWPSEELKRGFFLGVIVLTCYTVPLLLITVFYTLIACKVWNRDAPGFNSANSSQVRIPQQQQQQQQPI
jgi:hypothetical protein